MGEIVIRQGREEDAEALRELRMEALRTCPTAFGADYNPETATSVEEWRNRLRGGSDGLSAIFLACDGERLVGLTSVVLGASLKMRHTASLYAVYVAPEVRGGGVGARLITASTDWARSRGSLQAKLTVVVDNIAAIRCYVRCGFQVYGVDPKALFYDGVYYDELMMVKSLTAP